MADQPSITELVDEGMLVIGAAVRLAAKNTVIVSTLRDGVPWDEAALLETMRRDIRGLISERVADLARLESAIDRARGKPGQPRTPDDYRRLDVPLLERRREVSGALHARLGRLLRDEGALRSELLRARDSALTEIQSHQWVQSGLIHPSVDPWDRERQLKALRRQIASLRR